MSVATRKTKTAAAEKASKPLSVDLHRLASPQAISAARSYVQDEKARLRPGGKMIVNMKTMQITNVPIIECWHRPSRRYLPLMVGERWRYETREDRDAMLAALNAG